MNRLSFFALLIILVSSCKPEIKKPAVASARPDPHSFSMPQVAVTTHLDLNIECDFEKKIIKGVAHYDIQHEQGTEIILDIMDLNILEVSRISKDNKEEPVKFTIGDKNEFLGQALHIPIASDTRQIKINYETSPEALALQWLNKEQTISKKYPYLLTQSQSTTARSWVPCQDGPGIRFSYHAKLKVPEGMMAVMSANNSKEKSPSGIYEFNMEIPIPAYLLALAVGDFYFAPIGSRTGVYADSTQLEKAAWEFADLEKMVVAAEELYGPYQWGRYDVIVLPTGFPFGGMENPRVTFLTPTVIAGDRSLTALLAHELAHSWSGNLVTNATWEDFWLNEGFTTYFENRIMEKLYGKTYADMLSLLGLQDLRKTIKEMGDTSELTKLKLNLKDKNPEDALSDIAYEKGKLLLRYLEERLGREEWDKFLRKYFENFKFKSNTTEGFAKFLDQEYPTLKKEIRDTVETWLYQPGLIQFQPNYDNSRFSHIELEVQKFCNDPSKYEMDTKAWSTHEWIHFMRKLPIDSLGQFRTILDKKYHLSTTGNSEIAFCWINYLIDCRVGGIHIEEIEHFLLSVGRRKFVLPIYENMIKHDMRKEANEIYEKAKSSYHPITRKSIEEALEMKI